MTPDARPGTPSWPLIRVIADCQKFPGMNGKSSRFRSGNQEMQSRRRRRKSNSRLAINNARCLTHGVPIRKESKSAGRLQDAASGRENMRMSRRCMAAIAGAVVLVHVAAVHAQSPSAPTPEAEPSAKKNQPLPKIEVIAPKKKASRPAPPPPTKAAPAPAPTLVDVPSPPPAPAWAGAFEVPMSPTGGSGLPVDKVPAGISVINSTQIERVGSPSITEAINT